MRRKLFSFAAAVSLVLCVGTIVLWPLNRRRMEEIEYRTQTHSYLMVGRPEGMYFAVCRSYLDPVPSRGWNSKLRDAPPGWHFSTKSTQGQLVPSDATLKGPGFVAGAFDAYLDGPDHTRVRYLLVAYPWPILGCDLLRGFRNARLADPASAIARTLQHLRLFPHRQHQRRVS